jgi:hypothetical protein
MRRLLAIATLTWKAAFRFRLFWVLLALLLGAVVALPLLVKDDGTARGFTQILLTYTLSVITTLLGFSTLWLACGTLARDIEDCQMQMVAVKPIARWQIWLGKWLGIILLNAALLAVAGASVFGLMKWRAGQMEKQLADAKGRQDTNQIARLEKEIAILKNEIFVARGSLKEPLPDIDGAVEKIFRERIEKTPVPPAEHAQLRKNLREQLKAGIQIVPPGYSRPWVIDLGLRRHFLRDQPLYVRAKFHAAQTNAGGTYLGLWQAGVPERTRVWQDIKSQAADTYHEFAIPAGLFDEEGKLTVLFHNRNNTALLFPIEDGFEVLYREGGFGLNYARGLMVILCWLALLAALGLASASLMSFPVAAFFSASLLVVALMSGTLSSIVSEGSVLGSNHETGAATTSWINAVMIPFFRAILKVVSLVEGFSPVDSLSAGRSITWGQLGRACAQIVLLLGGIFSVAGMAAFTRRELATAQGNA